MIELLKRLIQILFSVWLERKIEKHKEYPPVDVIVRDKKDTEKNTENEK